MHTHTSRLVCGSNAVKRRVDHSFRYAFSELCIAIYWTLYRLEVTSKEVRKRIERVDGRHGERYIRQRYAHHRR